MSRRNMRQFVLWGITLLIMGIIFMFSAQSKADSAALSMNVRGLFVKVLTALGVDAEYMELLHYLVRKCAHVFLYLCLGVSTAASAQNSFKRRFWVWALLICFLYAASDELHQAFVPGRGPLVSDVFLDTISSAVGIAGFAFLCKFFGRKRRRNAD